MLPKNHVVVQVIIGNDVDLVGLIPSQLHVQLDSSDFFQRVDAIKLEFIFALNHKNISLDATRVASVARSFPSTQEIHSLTLCELLRRPSKIQFIQLSSSSFRGFRIGPSLHDCVNNLLGSSRVLCTPELLKAPHGLVRHFFCELFFRDFKSFSSYRWSL